MKIITLVENTSISDRYQSKHGLCFYIETQKHKILFDVGPDNLFLENAKKLGVDIAAVDTVIISHGHSDHGGGLKLFMEKNNQAKIYIREHGFFSHFTKVLFFQIPVGLDCSLDGNDRIIVTDERLVIDDELELFSGVMKRDFYSESNNALYEKTNGKYVSDRFIHEQNLIITEGNKKVLFAGCAHNGIVNILDKAQEISNGNITHVLAGMHLMNLILAKSVSKDFVKKVGERLKESKVQYYTCHCTGQKAYKVLRNVMGEQIKYAAMGSVIEL